METIKKTKKTKVNVKARKNDSTPIKCCRVNLRLTTNDYNRVEEAAFRDARTVSSWVWLAIEKALKRVEA